MAKADVINSHLGSFLHDTEDIIFNSRSLLNRTTFLSEVLYSTITDTEVEKIENKNVYYFARNDEVLKQIGTLDYFSEYSSRLKVFYSSAGLDLAEFEKQLKATGKNKTIIIDTLEDYFQDEELMSLLLYFYEFKKFYNVSFIILTKRFSNFSDCAISLRLIKGIRYRITSFLQDAEINFLEEQGIKLTDEVKDTIITLQKNQVMQI